MQDLRRERQGHPDRTVRPPAVYAVPHGVAGRLRGTGLLELIFTVSEGLSLFLFSNIG